MKKLLIVALVAFVSACACFECEDETPVITYQSSRQERLNCDYFDGRTCYRYTYRTVQRPVAQPVYYREPRPCNPCRVAAPTPVCNNKCSSCECNRETKISETREPVEVVYKKTTYKTVYEPKTYSEVSYEKAPYSSLANQETVEVVDNNQVVVEETK